MKKHYDVVVVGAGPAGSYVAGELARAGYGVAVVEQKSGIGKQVCCTGIIGQECVNSFAVDEDVILRRANSARLFSPSGRLLRPWREETQACIIDRAAFDMAMAGRAQDSGAEYALNCLVQDIEVKNDRVRIEAACKEEKVNLEAKAAVIATGFGSGLPERLGLGRIGDFAMGAQAEVETVGTDEVEVYFGQEVAPGFFGWMVPTLSNKALVGLLLRRSPGLYLKRLLASLLAQGRIVTNRVDPSYGKVPLKPLSRTYSERILVVGDAAGQVKPTTGGGIYYGLLCAGIAASNLCRLLGKDNLSARSLASYEREWRGKLGWEMRIGYWARILYDHLSDSQIDRAFDIIESNGIGEALLKADGLSFDWHGEAMLRLLGHKALSKVVGAMKIPSRHRGKD